jgi:hypothetical protein
VARTLRTLSDRLGVYRRDGHIVLGRAPYIADEEWRRVENPGRALRITQWVGLTYTPDRTRPRRPLGIFGRTED